MGRKAKSQAVTQTKRQMASLQADRRMDRMTNVMQPVRQNLKFEGRQTKSPTIVFFIQKRPEHESFLTFNVQIYVPLLCLALIDNKIIVESTASSGLKPLVNQQASYCYIFENRISILVDGISFGFWTEVQYV